MRVAFFELVALLALPGTLGLCINTTRPFEGSLCSGNGECVNDRCECYPGFTGIGVWMSSEGEDCHINDTALFVLNLIAYALGCLILLALCARMFQFGPLVLFRNINTLERGELRKRAPQKLFVNLLLSAILMIAQYTLFCFWKLFLHNSLASAIVFALFHASTFCYTFIRGTQITMLGIRTVRNMKVDTARMEKMIKLLMGGINLTVTIVHIVCILGVCLAPREKEKYGPTPLTALSCYLIGTDVSFLRTGFVFAYFIALILYNLAWFVVIVKFYAEILGTIAEHLKQASQLLSRTGDERVADVYMKMRRLRGAFGFSVGTQMILAVICLVLPPLATYYVPVYQIIGTFAVFAYLREAGNEPNQNHPPSGSGGSGRGTKTPNESELADTASTTGWSHTAYHGSAARSAEET